MKKKTLLLSVISFLAIGLSACNNKKEEPQPEPEPEPTPAPAVEPLPSDANLPTTISYLDEPGFQIHYQRTKPGYIEWGLWLWSEGKDGSEYKFNYQDDYGTIAYYPLSMFGNPHSLGFIVKQLFEYAGDGVWNKDYGDDRFIDFDMLQKDEHDIYHVYLTQYKAPVYVDPQKIATMAAVNLCQFETNTGIRLVCNNPLSEVKLLIDGVESSECKISGSGNKRTIVLNEAVDLSRAYSLYIKFEMGAFVTKSISIRKLYTADFDNEYKYDGDLGAIYTTANTTFRVWSPVSKSIKLRIYDNGTPTSVDAVKGSDTFEEYEMTKSPTNKGLFEYQVAGDLEGKYYTYVVNNAYFKDREIVDPYARSAGVNGLRGMIVDFNKTNPSNWSEVNYSQVDRKHLTVYETHVADITSSETWTGTASYSKKFKGMWEANTTYTEGGKTVKTGFDHIKELGVNAIQIIPFFDQANNEVDTPFNWGYNPLNYNVVEGAYSTDPFNGYTRIIELKEMIQAYKEAGIAVIMDVVYNHVNGLSGSNFDVLMPYYYFRYNDSTGSASSGSGCGNDTASEKAMFRKFMIDSTAFWAREYKLDGFRFDLMGLHDLNTMNSLSANLKQINNNITVYGEPWLMGTAIAPGTRMADQTNANSFMNFGQFNDKGRDALLAGGLSPAYAKGFMNSETNPVGVTEIKEMLKGITHGVTNDPNKTVNYATCHDNYTLHDRGIAASIYDETKLEGANIVANSIVMLSQGTSFMLAGEEMLRTKIVYDNDGNPVVNEEVKEQQVYKVSENSYSSPYKTNELNYSWKVNHLDLFETYKKLIQLKQTVADLGLNESEIKASESFKVSSERTDTIIKIEFANGADSYEAYIGGASLYSYAKDSDTPFNIDLTGKTIYLDSMNQEVSGNSIKLNPYETLILKK